MTLFVYKPINQVHIFFMYASIVDDEMVVLIKLLLASDFKHTQCNSFTDKMRFLCWNALSTGFDSCILYFYPVYLTILLIHRERRDSHYCRQKYGRDWDIYCSRVPYRIIPYIY